MKTKRMIVMVICIIILVLGIMLVIFNNQHNNSKEMSKYAPNNTLYEEDVSNIYTAQVDELVENEINGEEEKIIIDIEDENDKIIQITNKDMEFFRILALDGTEEEEYVKDAIIEYKIYAIEAKKTGISLSKETLDEIERLSNSSLFLDKISNNERLHKNLQKRLYNYLLDIEYKGALNQRVLEEIDNNNISINDDELNNKLEEYNNLKENFKNVENITENEKLNGVSKLYKLLMDIQEMYLNILRNKYIITYR